MMAFQAKWHYIQRIHLTVTVVVMVLCRWFAARVARHIRCLRKVSVLDCIPNSCSGVNLLPIPLAVLTTGRLVLGRAKIALNCRLPLLSSHVTCNSDSSQRDGPWGLAVRQYLSLGAFLAARLVSVLLGSSYVELVQRLRQAALRTGLHMSRILHWRGTMQYFSDLSG
jgi:hypothetical protein